MRSAIKAIIGLAAGLLTLASSAALADAIVSVTETTYDSTGNPVCTAVRMNPSTFNTAAGPAIQPEGGTAVGACARIDGGSNTYGPDRIAKTVYYDNGQVQDVYQAVGTDDQRRYAHYAYTNNGLKASETDANGNLTAYKYDGFDRLERVTYPVTTVNSNAANTGVDYEEFTYDDNGNQKTWRRRDGKVIGFDYDALNRQIKKDLPETTALDVYTSYDIAGRVLARRFGSPTSTTQVSYAYDSLGRLSATTDMNSRTISFGYNQAGARTRLTFPDSHDVSFERDELNRLHFIWYNNQMQISHAYDDFGRAGWTGRAVDGGNAGGWMVRHWDALGRLLDQWNEVNTPGRVIHWDFTYNPAGQLRQSTQDTEVYDYAPDIQAAEAKTFDGLNRDAGIAGVTGGYDLRGNLTFDGNRTFVYDVENRLVSASGTTIPGATFEYDPEGRLSKLTSGTTVTTFLYDGVNLIGEYDGSGNLKRRYIHGDGTDNPLVWLEETPTGEERRFFQKNYQGSIIGWSDDQGSLHEMYRYGAYGEPMGETGTNELWTGSRFRYTGQTVLTEARLYYYKARVYDPKFGRFLQTDPIGGDDDLDLYAYTAGDPVNKTDPTGNEGFVDGFWKGWGAYGISHSAGVDQNAVETPTKSEMIGYGVGYGLVSALFNSSSNVSGGTLRGGKISIPRETLTDVAPTSTLRPAPKANNGISPPHGNPDHNQEIDNWLASGAKQGATDQRKNQTQVDVNGNRVGDNRPDGQQTLNGQRQIYEAGRDPDRLKRQAERSRQNDPNCTVVTKCLK